MANFAQQMAQVGLSHPIPEISRINTKILELIHLKFGGNPKAKTKEDIMTISASAADERKDKK